jgi:hypothetical protein
VARRFVGLLETRRSAYRFRLLPQDFDLDLGFGVVSPVPLKSRSSGAQ